MRRIAPLLAVAFPLIGICADEPGGVLACSAIQNRDERIACYDQLANAIVPPVAIPAASSGKWRVTEDTNPIDDSKTVTLIILANNEERLGLVLRCKSGAREAYVAWGDYLADNTRVTSRIGSAPAVISNWSESADSLATFHPQPASFINSLMGETSFVAQITPYNENPKTAVFDIAGIDQAVQPLLDTCKAPASPSSNRGAASSGSVSGSIAAPSSDMAIEQGIAAARNHFPSAPIVVTQNVFQHSATGAPASICGEINASNNDGTYKGLTRFVTPMPGTKSFIESETKGFEIIWNGYCIVP